MGGGGGCQQGTSPSNFKTVICHLNTNIQPTGTVREAQAVRRERDSGRERLEC